MKATNIHGIYSSREHIKYVAPILGRPLWHTWELRHFNHTDNLPRQSHGGVTTDAISHKVFPLMEGGGVRLAGQQASVPYACISLPSSLVHERHGNLGFRDTVFIMYPNGFKVAVLVSSSNDIWCPSKLTYRDEQLGNGNATLVVFC